MIKANNEMVEIALGMTEEDYLEHVKDVFHDDQKTCVKFLNVYKNLTYQQREMVRMINPASMINPDKERVAFLYHVMLFDKYKDLFTTTINNFKDNMQEEKFE